MVQCSQCGFWVMVWCSWVTVCFFFFFFFAIFCGCGGLNWWLVAVMVGECGGCVIGRWMWWPVVLRIVGLRKRETEERERKNKK